MIKMLIAPKFGEHNTCIHPNVLQDFEGTLEIQMIDRDLSKSFDRCKTLINSSELIEEVILHMPFGLHLIESFMMSAENHDKLIKFIIDCIRLGDSNHINIGILFHSEFGSELFDNCGCEQYVRYLHSLVEDTNVFFIFENGMVNFNCYDPTIETSFEIMSRISDLDKIVYCLDVCHLKSHENAVKNCIDIPKEILDKIHSIHFSATLNNDGFLNKKETHSLCHSDLAGVIEELGYITNKVVDLNNTIIVVEVTEKDYNDRPDMRKELALLRSARKKLNLSNT